MASFRPTESTTSEERVSKEMGKKKLDFVWAIVVVVVLGATSTTLLGNDAPRMEAHQAGLFGR
jgi:hypothetical protein